MFSLIHDQPLIEVKVNSIAQLFDARDPAPFRTRDLDDDFVEYVIASADELSVSRNLEIIIHVDEPQQHALDAVMISDSIHSFFQYQIDLKRLQLAKLFKMSRLFLFLGSICLVACLFLARFLEANFDETSPYRTILREGVIIFGWVSLWKPFELILFDWYPLYDRMRLLRQLARSEIRVLFKEAVKS